MSNEKICLGQLPETVFRDAVHVAIAVVIADETLNPGQHIGLVGLNRVAPCDNNIGIVDPFLTQPVEKEQKLIMCMYPGTVSDVRHIWNHPAFAKASATQKKS